MHVMATRDGTYAGKYRKAGDEFPLTDKKHFSKRWMVEEGTQAYTDFVRGMQGRDKDAAAIDKITGERINAGGVAEQLAITLDDNRKLQARIVELEAELAIHTADADKKQEPVPSQTPAEGNAAQDEAAEKVVRRRRHTKDE